MALSVYQLIHLHVSLFLHEKMTSILYGNQSGLPPPTLRRLSFEYHGRAINIMMQWMFFPDASVNVDHMVMMRREEKVVNVSSAV